MKQLLANAAVVVGMITGVLVILDWVLSDIQKAYIRTRAELSWYWLADQKTGRFVSVVRNNVVQFWFSIVTHGAIILMLLLLVSNMFLGTRFPVQFQMGFPRIYEFQIFIEIAAVLISMIGVSLFLHPRTARWISQAGSLPRYFGRTALMFGILFVIIGIAIFPFLYLLKEVWDVAANAPSAIEGIAQVRALTEAKFGGPTGVIATHILSSIFLSVVFTELMMVQTILFLSAYWIILILGADILLKVCEFLAFRIATYDKGPVLAVSALSTGIGTILKAFG